VIPASGWFLEGPNVDSDLDGGSRDIPFNDQLYFPLALEAGATVASFTIRAEGQAASSSVTLSFFRRDNATNTDILINQVVVVGFLGWTDIALLLGVEIEPGNGYFFIVTASDPVAPPPPPNPPQLGNSTLVWAD
jgi:hypothetical protein